MVKSDDPGFSPDGRRHGSPASGKYRLVSECGVRRRDRPVGRSDHVWRQKRLLPECNRHRLRVESDQWQCMLIHAGKYGLTAVLRHHFVKARVMAVAHAAAVSKAG